MKKLFTLFVVFFVVSVALLGLLVLTATRQEAQKVTSSKIPIITSPTPPPDRILFVSNRSGNNDIYMMNLLTKQTVNLTKNPGEDMNPQPSQDGKYIVFYSNRSGENQIYRMTLSNGETKQLTTSKGNNYDPAYSPDGNYIVFKSTRSDTRGDIFIMNADGSNPKNLTFDKKLTEEWDPVFTLDSNQILFVERSRGDDLTDEIMIMDRDGNNPAQLTRNAVPDWYPSVNPVDGRIIYISKPRKSAPDSIYIMNGDGSGKTKLTDLPGNSDDPYWNAKGEKIIFINDNDGNYDLYSMNADGTNVQRIEKSRSNELSPVFLP